MNDRKKENILSYFTVNEFAEKIRVHPNTVRNAIKCGRIQAIRIGQGKRSSYRIESYEFKRMMEFDSYELIEKIINKRDS